MLLQIDAERLHRAVARSHQAAHGADQRGLAGTIGAKQRENLPLADRQVDVVEFLEATRINLCQAGEFQNRFLHRN